jgi:hypothetical protein
MGVSEMTMIRNERKHFAVWAAELPGLSLNYFADELPAAYLRDRTGKPPKDFPVLRRCEVRARVRRGCFASAVSAAPDMIAADVSYADRAGPVHEVGWLVSQLPVAFRAGYDRTFHRRMLALAIRMWEGMKDGTFVLPSCTAEEILIGIILDRYALELGLADLGPGYLDLEDLFLEDMDFLMLYNIVVAQRPDVLTALGSELLTVNLGFALWFEPFRKSQKVPGPASERVLREINGE